MINDARKRYIEAELEFACPLPLIPANKNGSLWIQIGSEQGKTKYIGITPEQFRKIELVLLEEL